MYLGRTTFNFYNGTTLFGSIENVQLISGSIDVPNGGIPTKTGYTFAGWYIDDTGSSQGTTTVSRACGSGGLSTINKTVNFYAKWTAQTSTVTLNQQSGTGGTTSVTATYDSAMPSATMPTRTGYTFGGYFTGTNGTGTQYYNANGTSSRTWNLTGSQTLYAKWSANTTYFTFNTNKPSAASGTISGTQGDLSPAYNAALSSSAFSALTLTGWTFNGWYTNKAFSGSSVAYNTTVTDTNFPIVTNDNPKKASETTSSAKYNLYAKWTANTTYFTFNTNKPSNATGTISGTQANLTPSYDSVLSSSAFSALTLTGWTFNGWYTNKAFSGSAVTIGTYVTDTNFPIVTNDNAKKASETSSSAYYTLYAKWTAQTSAVTLDPQSGTGSTASVTATYDSAMPSATMPTRDGYTFQGYFDQTGGAGNKYYNADGSSARTWNKTGAQTLYASWSAKPLYLTIKAKYGTAEAVTLGDYYPNNIIGNEITPDGSALAAITGYVYDYFDPASVTVGSYNSSTKKYTFGGDNGCITAVFRKEVYDLTFDHNYTGKPANTARESQTYGSNLTAALSDPVRAGYVFEGWYKEASCSTLVWAAGDTAHAIPDFGTDGSSYTLFAKWVPAKFLVTFDGNGGTPSPANKQVTYTETYGTLATAVRSGYTLSGWQTADGTAVTATSTVEIPEAHTLYAVWTPNPYTIRFYQNYSVSDDTYTDNTKGYQTAIGQADPVRPGYDFLGWYTVRTDGTQVYAPGAAEAALMGMHDPALLLYAQWQLRPYYIMYNGMGATIGTMEQQCVYYGEAATLTANAFKKSGGIFCGWDTDPAAATVVYTDAQSFSACPIDHDLTLYAVWLTDTTPPKLHLLDQNAESYLNSIGLTGIETAKLPYSVLIGQ
ncbi:MAG: InlB B-repeat-containing protein, partial [Oscillospiraceae bacterium]|nr:InlB B-repeat-containing protein [Oscillospiraceae bacterium]